MRILEECGDNKPQILVMENVKNLLSNTHRRHFLKLCERLKKMGYSNWHQVMDSADYGIPQHRERVFMVSILGDYRYDFPKKKELKYCMQDFCDDKVDDKYYLSERMINFFFTNSEKQKELGNGFRFTPIEREHSQNIDSERRRTNGEQLHNRVLRIGYVNSEGKAHQSGEVFDPRGLCRTLQKSESKNPTKIKVT